MILILIIAVICMASVGEAIRRHKKPPFYPHVMRKDDTQQISVRVMRTKKAKFPAAADDVDVNTSTHGKLSTRHHNWCVIDRVSPNDEDADEKLIAAIVQAKNLAKEWSIGGGDDLKALYENAQRALKR